MKNFRTILVVLFWCIAAGLSSAELSGEISSKATEKNYADTAAQTGTLTIRSNVANAEVYLDGGYVGKTPVTISSLAPGLYEIIVKKEGYYGESYTVRIIANKETILSASIFPITGKLRITDIPDNTRFEIVIDEKVHTSKLIELPAGDYTVTVREFGYIERSIPVTIVQRQETVIDGKLEKAVFNANGLNPSKPAFNPENPANLGSVELSFLVTAPGKGNLVINDSEGKAVRTLQSGPFTVWKQTLRWDGTDETGADVPDGDYGMVLEAADIAGASSVRLASSVRVDRSIVYPFTGADAGIGSTGPVVSGSLMPKGARLIDFGIAACPGIFSPGVSFLAGITNSIEGGVRANAVVDDDSNTTMDLALGLKAGRTDGGLHSALALSFRARPSGIPDDETLFRNGLSFGPAVEYAIGHFALGIYPAVSYGNDEGFFVEPYGTASAGIAARFTGGGFSAGTWANADTGAFGGEFTVLADWSTGISVQFMIPATNLLISGEGGYQDTRESGGRAFFRGGFGILF